MRRSKADAEQTRTEILDAAERLFCAQGITSTSLDRVAAAAGVTRGAVYWHFKDKSEILLALRERCFLPQETLIEVAAVEGHPDPIGLLTQCGKEILGLFEAEERRQRVFAILSSQIPSVDDCRGIDAANREVCDVLARLMALAKEAGMLSDALVPDEAALFVMVTMNGLLSEWLRSGKSFPLSEIGGRILDAQMQSLRRSSPVPSGPMPSGPAPSCACAQTKTPPA